MSTLYLPLYLVIRRLLLTVLTLVMVSFIVFFATALLPGDVAEILLGQASTPEAAAALRQAMGIDQPAIQRFFGWFFGIMQGDLRTSYVTGLPVRQMIGDRLANSIRLAALTTMVAVPVSLLLGIMAAMWRGSIFDRVVSALTISVISVPEFMVATLAVLIFAVWLRWLPALSYGGLNADSIGQILRFYAMPVMTLGFVVSAQMIRMTRAAVIETIETPYVEMALLKGASPARTVLRHALPNAFGPIANAMALSLSYLLGGVIIVETIFNYPGVAKLMLDSVATRDLPLIQSCTVLFCTSYLVLITAADIVAILSNPRLRK